MKTECPKCKQSLDIDDKLQGLTVQCPTCQHYFEPPVIEEPKRVKPPLTYSEKKMREAVILLYVCLIIVPLFGWLAAFEPPEYEYRIVIVSDSQWVKDMETAGNNGWDLVFARRASTSESFNAMAYEMIFKRPK
jgi:hypothetical protein